MDKWLKYLFLAGGILIVAGVAIFITRPILFAQEAPQIDEQSQPETQNKTQSITGCTDLAIEISEGSAESAVIKQTSGSQPVGNLVIQWFYKERGPVEDTVTIESSRGVVRAESGATGQLDQIRASSSECSGLSANYEPSQED